jgi:hypothetical protein
MIKVEGYSNLYRDEKTGAIVNCDSTTYDQYVNSLNIKEKKKEELDNIKKDIMELKLLLKEILKSKS